MNPKLKKRLTLIGGLLCGFALIFTATFGVIIGVRNSRAVLSYQGVTVSEGVYRYFASYCKYRYVQSLRSAGVQVSDVEAFYQLDSGDGVTYGEELQSYTDAYIEKLLVASYLFDHATSLTSDDKKAIRTACQNLLTYSEAAGDADTFNDLTAKYGFTYRDLEKAAAIMYKTNMLFALLYGTGGVQFAYDTDACDAFYTENYVRVKLLFIRTEDTFLLDLDGNKVYDESGNAKTVALTQAQKDTRQADILNLDLAMAGSGSYITETMLSTYMAKYGEGDPTYDETGYYLCQGTTATADMNAAYPEVTEAAFSMQVGEYRKVTTSVGVCYLYRAEAEAEAYADEDLSVFFSDFYANGAIASFESEVNKRCPDVVKTDRWERVNIFAIPYNTDFLVRFE